MWTRLTTYASEHKVVVYTIGAVVVVAGAGGIYYLSQSGETGKGGKPKKDRRKDVKDKASSKDKAISEGEISNWTFQYLSDLLFHFFTVLSLWVMDDVSCANYPHLFQKLYLLPRNPRILFPRLTRRL